MKVYKIMKSFFPPLVLVFFLSACGQSNYELASTAYNDKDFERAFIEFSFLADGGDIKAQYFLGLMHEKGQHVEQDFKKAAKWYKKSAKKGYPAAQIRLAHLYIQGAGVERD